MASTARRRSSQGPLRVINPQDAVWPSIDKMTVGLTPEERFLVLDKIVKDAIKAKEHRESQSKTVKPRVYVRLTAVWGNDDAESFIRVSRRRWQSIQDGAEYSTKPASWYEGERTTVVWSFVNGAVSIEGDDGMQLVLNQPVGELMAEVVKPE